MDEPQQGKPAADEERVLAEIKAMQAVSAALMPLNKQQQNRVLTWVTSALGLGVVPKQGVAGTSIEVMGSPLAYSSEPVTVGMTPATRHQSPTYGTLHDLYAAAQPSGEPERALVIGYWLQVLQGSQDFDAQTVNSELRQLGYPIQNITQAFTALMNRKPSLVMQTKKSGTAHQARKRLKLTSFGVQAVERQLASRGSGGADDSGT